MTQVNSTVCLKMNYSVISRKMVYDARTFHCQGSCGSTLFKNNVFQFTFNDFLLTKMNKLILMYTLLSYVKRKITAIPVSILHAPSDNNDR